MATASQIVDALLMGFEHQDHPSVQAALDQLVVQIEMYYKPDEDSAPHQTIRYESIREALNIFRVNPLSAINRLMKELHDINQDDPEITVTYQILIETIEKVTTLQPVVSVPDDEDADDLSLSRTVSPQEENIEAEEPDRRKKRRADEVQFDDPNAAPAEAESGMEPSSPEPQPAPPSAPAAPAPSFGGAPPSPKVHQTEEEKTLDWLEDFSGDVDSEILEEPATDPPPGLEVDDKTITGDPDWLMQEARRQKFITETGTFEVVVSDDDTQELPAVKEEEADSAADEGAAATEAVEAYFSAYFPPEVRQQTHYGLYIYAHTADALESIKQNVAQFKDQLGGDVPEATVTKSHTSLQDGTLLTVVPESDHAVFDPPQQTRAWNNDWIRFDFDFMPEAVYQSELVMRVSIQIAGIEIAHIPCVATINATSDGPRHSINPLADARLRSVVSRMYQKIFVSYSRDDTPIAECYRLAQMAAGQQVFMDSYSIRAGEHWQGALARAIDEADIFQLFWSHNSAQSQNVRDEWEYALGYRCPEDRCVRFIRPVFWEKPLPTPPTELAHLNFKFVPFQGIEETDEGSITTVDPALADVMPSNSEVMERLDHLDQRMTAIEDSLEIIKQALRAIYHRMKE